MGIKTMINNISDLDVLEPALHELKKAAEACRRMAKVGVGSFSEYKDWDPEMKVVGKTLSFEPWSRTLLPVTNHGITFQPPEEHLGVRLGSVSPLDVAHAAITFYCTLFNDVLTDVVFG